MNEERIETDGVPAKLYDPGCARGLLLLGHGGGQSKDGERFVRMSRHYAEKTDLAVVCIDAVDHGERAPAAAGPGIPRRWHSSAAQQMVADWTTTVAALSGIGPPLAYVGFSMGMIFGAPVVVTMPSIKAVVFGVGGIPAGGGIDDPPLRSMLLEAASKLEAPQVLMINKTADEVFPIEGTHEFFAAIPGDRKRLMFWPGTHDDWPAEAIRHSVDFVNQHT